MSKGGGEGVSASVIRKFPFYGKSECSRIRLGVGEKSKKLLLIFSFFFFGGKKRKKKSQTALSSFPRNRE